MDHPAAAPNTNPTYNSMTAEAATPSPTVAPAPVPAPVTTSRVVLVYSVVPDFCKMPNGTTVPFDLIAFYTDSVDDSANVFANNHRVCKLDTTLFKCSGNESAAGGISSSTILQKVEMIPNGCTVNTNGKLTMQDGNLVFINNQNTVGQIKVVDAGTAAEIAALYGVSAQKYNKELLKLQRAAKKYRQRLDKPLRGKGAGARNAQSLKDLSRRIAELSKQIDQAMPGLALTSKKLPLVVTGNIKYLRHLSKALLALQVGQIAYSLYEGDTNEAAKLTTGLAVGTGVGMAGGAACGALGLAGGVPGVLCAGVVIVASGIAGAAAAELSFNERQCTMPSPESPTQDKALPPPTPAPVPGPIPN